MRFSPTKNLYEPFLSPWLAARPAQLNLPDLVTRIILGEKYEWDWLREEKSVMKRPGLMFRRPGHMPGYHILGVCVVFVGTSRQNKKVASKRVYRLTVCSIPFSIGTFVFLFHTCIVPRWEPDYHIVRIRQLDGDASLLTRWGRSGPFKLFKRPFPAVLTILTH